MYLRSEIIYNTTINYICPDELDDNYAGKDGLYFNSSNIYVKKSILKKILTWSHILLILISNKIRPKPEKNKEINFKIQLSLI